MYYDTHAHLDDARFDQDREALLSSMASHGVALINNIGCDMTSSMKSVRLAETYPFIYAVVGTWPGYTCDMKEADLAMYRALSQKPKVVAIGEIGLDYHYDDTPRDVQQLWFDRQMSLADEVGLPVVVHEREAHRDAMAIVRRWAKKVPGVFHCYSGGVEMAQELVKLGWYVSFTGVITFANARRALEVVQAIPLEKMFIETDSPYLAPVPYRGKRNDSTKVPLVAQKIAEIKGISPEAVAETTMENAKRFFRIPEGGAEA